LNAIALSAGLWRAKLRPEVGGSLAALDCAGVPVLRTMVDDAADPLQAACFPLVPYCNRIRDGRFRFAGREVRVAPNLADQPHPLHGTGWLRPWRVVRHDATSALLEDDYRGEGDWPWPYRAHQHVALDEMGVTIRLMVENRSTEPAPLGLGLHPYFRRASDSVVTFVAREMLAIDPEVLPDGTRLEPDALARWSAGAKLPSTLVDHCFGGWDGIATIADAQGTVALRGFGTPCLHVYAPARGAELCLEPVGHSPDALNRAPEEIAVVPPGAATGVALQIATN